jgi:hypothetical protein
MNAPRYAQNKRELAKLAGMSHTTLYRLLRLPGAPRPRADGRWPVSAIRSFALKEAKKLEGPKEEDRLRMELLNLKIRRASQELVEFEQRIRNKITDEVRVHFKSAVNILAGRLKTLPRDLATKCEGLSAQEMFKLSTDLLYAAFAEARKDFDAAMPEEAEEKKLIVFGNGVSQPMKEAVG